MTGMQNFVWQQADVWSLFDIYLPEICCQKAVTLNMYALNGVPTYGTNRLKLKQISISNVQQVSICSPFSV